jgi:hypothetical protein
MDRTAQEPQGPVSWSDVVRTTLRLLFFRVSRAELINLGWKHLAFGLACTWVVGVGRYWDNPRVGLAPHLGLGSVVYGFVLALFLWLLVWPLRPRDWTYFRVLTFVSLVSPPAILYAIPVEHFSSIETADGLNLLFLAIVATWRVALLVFFLRRLGELNWFSIAIAALLPLTLIIVTLTVLNLEKAVFSIMGGIEKPTAGDASFFFLVLLSYFSILIFIPLLICYLVVSINLIEYRRRRKNAPDGT